MLVLNLADSGLQVLSSPHATEPHPYIGHGHHRSFYILNSAVSRDDVPHVRAARSSSREGPPCTGTNPGVGHTEDAPTPLQRRWQAGYCVIQEEPGYRASTDGCVTMRPVCTVAPGVDVTGVLGMESGRPWVPTCAKHQKLRRASPWPSVLDMRPGALEAAHEAYQVSPLGGGG